MSLCSCGDYRMAVKSVPGGGHGDFHWRLISFYGDVKP
jgi:hypothetical protein